MKFSSGLITLVVLSADRAIRLKEILEFHGIKVVLEKVMVNGFELENSPRKVRVPIDSLQLGMKILESGDLINSPGSMFKMTGMGRHLLIPVEFSPSSLLAVKVGFNIAQKLDIEPIILHAYLAPMFSPADPYTDTSELPDAIEVAEQIDLQKMASAQLTAFKALVNKGRKDGSIPDIHFSTTILEGIPEQVIQEYCKQNKPALVVMATRGIHKKESDLVGSVTAEVIDSCRVPILTVPDNVETGSVDSCKRIVFFATFSGFDLLAIRGLMRTLDFPSCEIFLVPASERHVSDVEQKLNRLRIYLKDTYPTVTFKSAVPDGRKFDDFMRDLIDRQNIQTLIVPNKKSSAFSRFFRPTLAHRIIFERDIPLLVLPV